MHAFAVSETASGAGGYWPLAPVCFCNTSQSCKKMYGFATQRISGAGAPVLRFSRSVFRLLYAGFCPGDPSPAPRSPQADALANALTASTVPLRFLLRGGQRAQRRDILAVAVRLFPACPRHTARPAADAPPLRSVIRCNALGAARGSWAARRPCAIRSMRPCALVSRNSPSSWIYAMDDQPGIYRCTRPSSFRRFVLVA